MSIKEYAGRDEIVKSWNDLEDRPFYSRPNPNYIPCEGTLVYETLSTGYTGVYLPDGLQLDETTKYNTTIGSDVYENNTVTVVQNTTSPIKVLIAISVERGVHITYRSDIDKWLLTDPAGTIGESVYIKVEDIRGDTLYERLDDNFLPEALGTQGAGAGGWVFNDPITNVASGGKSHAEGSNTTASGSCSHAEGYGTVASYYYAHAEGCSTTASGVASHAEGNGTIAASEYQHVQGKYNVEDTSKVYAHIVGNGTKSKRSNAHTLDWNGNAWYAGTIEGTAIIVASSTEGSTKKFKITVDDSGTISAVEVTE